MKPKAKETPEVGTPLPKAIDLMLVVLSLFISSIVTASSVSPYGTILLPSMAVRVGNSSLFSIQTRGRISSPTDNKAVMEVIDQKQMALIPESQDTEQNSKNRKAYFDTFALSPRDIQVSFDDGLGLGSTTQSAKDGLFDTQQTINIPNAQPDQKIWFRIKDVPLKTFSITAEEEGFSIVTDIDDTIRLSGVAWMPTLVKKSFKDPFEPTPTMPDFFKSMQQSLVITTSSGRRSPPTFHYLSGSPIQYLPAIQPWLERVYPQGESVLPALAVSDGGLFGLMKYQDFKVQHATMIIKKFPKRKMILIGDSTQFDPEAYAKVTKSYPSNVQCVFIRISTGFNRLSESRKNKDKRFEKAFEGIDKSKWSTFHTSADLPTAEEIAAGKCRK